MSRITIAAFSLIIMAFVSGCNGTPNVNNTVVQERKDSVEMVRTGELRFTMDSETSPNLLTSFYDAKSGFYYFYNSITGYIERFHEDSTVKSPIRIKTSGMPWGLNIVSSDSIYLLDIDAKKIRIINSTGLQTASYNIGKESNIMPGGEEMPYITPLGLAYSSATTDDGPCLFIIDDSTGNIISRHFPYPKMYSDFYGDLLMRTPYTAYNKDSGVIIAGFPADDNIYVMDMETMKTTAYNAGSRYSNGKLKPLAKGLLGGINISPEKEIEYFREVTSYANLLHDPWRHVYYRIVEKSTPMPGVNLSNKAKQLAVLILDESFRTIGESDITDQAYTGFRYTIFVSPEGLNIQMLTGEDELTFAVYTLKQK